MLFSERHGHKKVEKNKMREKMPDHLRTRIWNVFYTRIFKKIGDPDAQFLSGHLASVPYRFLEKLWDKFMGYDAMTFAETSWESRLRRVRSRFAMLLWYEVYDFVEFFAEHYEDKDTMRLTLCQIDTVLAEEKVPYRILNDIVVPIISQEEIKEIEKALDVSDRYKPVREHLSKALAKWSARESPDYANSIKESISAVESLVMIVKGKKDVLPSLIDDLNIHPAMKEGFKRLYGWTSDENGVRHGKHKEPLSCGELEARYMLITCSAFINYVVDKLGNE